MPRIAISYRRFDTAAITGRLFDRLVAHFGRGNVFMDTDAIPLGVDFRTHIAGVLTDTDVLVVVIGDAWLGSHDAAGSRIFEPADPVRIEVETAIANGLAIIPILVDGALMPAPDAVPPTFGPFCYLNALHLAIGQDFHRHVDRLIETLDPRLDRANEPALTMTNLPARTSALVGRDKELAEIRAYLAASRLVTLVGSGGIGKTRTAVEVATNGARDYGEPWFIDLAPLADPAHVAGAIADALGITDQGSEPLLERIAAALRTKTLLLLMDNCEHVLGAVRTAVPFLMRACPGLRVLATSREPLAVAGEQIFQLAPLPVPPNDAPATAKRVMESAASALFVARARAADSRFVLTDENAPIVADIVRRLDGIALAIELAAPRIKLLSIGELRRRLDDRFRLLAGRDRSVLPRHQTLHALIGWSYDLLDDAEQHLLRQTAIFRGSWTLEAAEDVCFDERAPERDVLDVLAALVDKSLIVVLADDEQQRYRLLESTRDFALERLDAAGERDTVAARHARYYAQLALDAHDAHWRGDPTEWMTQARLDLENYRAAIAWGLAPAGDAVAAATIVAGLHWLWSIVALREGRDAIARARSALPADAPQRIRGLLKLASAAAGTNAISDAAEAAEALAGIDAVGAAEALVHHGVLHGYAGHIDAAVEILTTALAAARATRLPRLIGFSLNYAAYWIGMAGDTGHALRLFEEGAALLRACNDCRDLAYLEANRAEILFGIGDAEGALAAAREAQALYRSCAMDDGTQLNVPGYLLALGRLDEAWTAARESLTWSARTDSQFLLVIALGHLGHLAAESEQPVRACRLLGYTDVVYTDLGWERGASEQRGYDRALALIRAALSEDDIRSHMTHGKALEREQAVAEAMAVMLPASLPR